MDVQADLSEKSKENRYFCKRNKGAGATLLEHFFFFFFFFFF